MGTGPPVQAWSPVAAAPIPDTQGPGVCPRAACGGASQGLPRPLVPPLPQTQTPRVSAVLPQGAEPSPGPGSPAPTPCVVTLTCLPLTERTRPCTHACGPKGHPPPVPQRAKPQPPLCTLQPAAAAQAAPDSRVLDPGGHITSVFTCASSHWSAEGMKGDGATKAGAVGRMRGLIHAPGRGTSRQRAWGREVRQAQPRGLASDCRAGVSAGREGVGASRRAPRCSASVSPPALRPPAPHIWGSPPGPLPPFSWVFLSHPSRGTITTPPKSASPE